MSKTPIRPARWELALHKAQNVGAWLMGAGTFVCLLWWGASSSLLAVDIGIPLAGALIGTLWASALPFWKRADLYLDIRRYEGQERRPYPGYEWTEDARAEFEWIGTPTETIYRRMSDASERGEVSEQPHAADFDIAGQFARFEDLMESKAEKKKT